MIQRQRRRPQSSRLSRTARNIATGVTTATPGVAIAKEAAIAATINHRRVRTCVARTNAKLATTVRLTSGTSVMKVTLRMAKIGYSPRVAVPSIES